MSCDAATLRHLETDGFLSVKPQGKRGASIRVANCGGGTEGGFRRSETNLVVSPVRPSSTRSGGKGCIAAAHV